MQAFQLNLQKAFNDIVLLNGRYFNSDFDLGFLSLSDLESDFFKVLEPFVTSDRKNVFIQVVEFWIAAFCDDSEHEGIVGPVVFQDLVLELNDDIHFLNGAREQSGFAEWNIVPVDVNEILSFGEFC